MLPIITEEMLQQLFPEVLQDVNSWRKGMVHYIKEENPEVNTAIIKASQDTGLDPKAVALGAYIVYNLLEAAAQEQDNLFSSFNK